MARQIGRPAAAICGSVHPLRIERINRPVKNLNRNPRQATELLSQQNLPTAELANENKSACVALAMLLTPF
jgi:hypothetical protein